MKPHRLHGTPLVLALGALLSAPNASLGEERERAPIATTPHFAFYSDFATNLNDALIAAGDARRRGRQELFQSGPDKDCFDALPVAERAAWERAVDYYAEIVAPSGNFGREQMLLRRELVEYEEETEKPEDQRFIGIARGFLDVAAPVYESCRWPTRNAKNRRWVDGLALRLAAHEESIAQRMQDLYQKSWPVQPIPVDVVPAALWAGASTITGPSHIMISSLNEGNQDNGGLEIVFHEASHVLMTQNDPVWRALDQAAEVLGQPTPEDLWHVVMFYTTGDTVRRVLDEAGEPGYTPHLYEIFERSRDWSRYRDAIETIWPPYMDGERTLSEAAADLIRATSSQTGE